MDCEYVNFMIKKKNPQLYVNFMIKKIRSYS